jgi:hypothetical protein
MMLGEEVCLRKIRKVYKIGVNSLESIVMGSVKVHLYPRLRAAEDDSARTPGLDFKVSTIYTITPGKAPRAYENISQPAPYICEILQQHRHAN